jgi:hypothetical protein
MTYGPLANRATGGVIGGYREMDKVEKMDCRANSEVIFCAMSPLLSQSPKISDPISQRIGLTGRRNGVRCPIIQAKNNELS